MFLDNEINDVLEFERELHEVAYDSGDFLNKLDRSRDNGFVVGPNIGNYWRILRYFGIRDYWQIEKDALYRDIFKKIYDTATAFTPNELNSFSMEAYIRYVLHFTDKDLIVMLPDFIGILKWPSFTAFEYDAIFRLMDSDNCQRIHFLKGFYDFARTNTFES